MKKVKENYYLTQRFKDQTEKDTKELIIKKIMIVSQDIKNHTIVNVI